MPQQLDRFVAEYITEPEILALPFCQYSGRESLPFVPALYFVVVDYPKTQIIYIGKTINLYSRWRGHHKDVEIEAVERIGIFARIHYFGFDINTSEQELTLKEFILLQRFSPPLNAQLSPPLTVAAAQEDRRRQCAIKIQYPLEQYSPQELRNFAASLGLRGLSSVGRDRLVEEVKRELGAFYEEEALINRPECRALQERKARAAAARSWQSRGQRLEDLSLRELQKLGAQFKIKRSNHYRKDELIEKIRALSVSEDP